MQVPFLGKAVTVGFNFCTRERPFTLAVAFIGGGGWLVLRLSPDGLDVLDTREKSLQRAASLAEQAVALLKPARLSDAAMARWESVAAALVGR